MLSAFRVRDSGIINYGIGLLAHLVSTRSLDMIEILGGLNVGYSKFERSEKAHKMSVMTHLANIQLNLFLPPA